MGDADELIGRTIADRYRVDELIARGGMARVYRAHDERLARDVALKVLAEPYASDAGFAGRFLDEARTAAGIAHVNLVHVYDSGLDAGVHYIVMELLTGYRTLRQRLTADGPMPAADAVDAAREVLAGLAAVHERGFVHCDVKSSNVMVGHGPTKLIDFGIARTPAGSGRGGTSLGSLHAMPPEQLRNEPLSPASDLFATGVVLYEALTGRVPFDADSPEAMLAAQRRPAVPASELVEGVPSRLDDVIAQALRREPAERFRNASAMATALRAAAPAPARPTDETQPVPVASAARRGGPDAGYVPPLAMPGPPPRSTTAPERSRRPRRVARGGGGLGAWVVILVGLGAGLFVVWLVLSSTGTLPGGTGGSSPASGSPTPTLAPGLVRVPDTIGMSEAAAEAAARASGLNWRLMWQVNAEQSPGVYDQEPAAGEVVQAGSRFVMYAWRAPD